MKDFSQWEKFNMVLEGSGRSEKIWLINPNTKQNGFNIVWITFEFMFGLKFGIFFKKSPIFFAFL